MKLNFQIMRSKECKILLWILFHIVCNAKDMSDFERNYFFRNRNLHLLMMDTEIKSSLFSSIFRAIILLTQRIEEKHTNHLCQYALQAYFQYYATCSTGKGKVSFLSDHFHFRSSNKKRNKYLGKNQIVRIRAREVNVQMRLFYVLMDIFRRNVTKIYYICHVNK